MDEVSIDLLLQMSDDELAEVLEELSGIEFPDDAMPSIRMLLKEAGSVDGVFELLDELDPPAEAA